MVQNRGMADAEVFLQWKGTDACMDFWCPCGAALHYDGYFGDQLTCGRCGQSWQLPHALTAVAADRDPSVLKLVYDTAVVACEAGAEFRVEWPQSPLPPMVAGAIVQVVDDDDGVQRNVYADLLRVERVGDRARLLLRTRDRADGPCNFPLTRRERAFLIDAVMVLIHGMQQVPENDLSELPELEALQRRLEGYSPSATT